MPSSTTTEKSQGQEIGQTLPSYIIYKNVRWRVVSSFVDTVLVEPVNSTGDIQERRFFSWMTPGIICENEAHQKDNVLFLGQQESKQIPINSKNITAKQLQDVLPISTRQATQVLGYKEKGGSFQNLNHFLEVLQGIGVNISPKEPFLKRLYFGHFDEQRAKTDRL